MGLSVHERFKYPSIQGDARSPVFAEIDGLRNFFAPTFVSDGLGQAQLERGINAMASAGTKSNSRRPAILIRSSLRKAGTSTTPWHDSYDMDGGRVRYFGDAKVQHMPNPRKPPGNKTLLEQFDLHTSPERSMRLQAAPLLFFVAPERGIVEFRGFGLIENVELVSQIEPRTGEAFSNYAFDCALLGLASEGEQFDWAWIAARKNPALTLEESLDLAPASWKTWVTDGADAVSRSRRVVARMGITKKEDQLPVPGSPEERVLEEIYDFYSADGLKRKARFEAVAEAVSEFVITESHGQYRTGWITRGTGDGGVDFVGRLDVGSGFSKASLVVLGQAKCEAPNSSTSGKDIARTVARLRRGWIGCYVTTGTFSTHTQQEVADDRYPLILIPGGQVARSMRAMALRDGITVNELLHRIDARYEERVRDRDPSQVLNL
jgi:hypothetical protein